MTKRVFDILGAFCGLVLFAPLFVVIAFLIKMAPLKNLWVMIRGLEAVIL